MVQKIQAVYSKSEAAERRNAALTRLLSMPPKPFRPGAKFAKSPRQRRAERAKRQAVTAA